jgi:hypothetical protein
MKTVGLLIATSLIACRTSVPQEEIASLSVSVPGAAKVDDSPDVLLHCIRLQPPRTGDCDRGNPLVEELVNAARTQEFWPQVVDEAMVLDGGSLPLHERLIAQNALLYMAMFEWPGRIDAIRLMRSLALEPAKLESLGTKPTPEIGSWIDAPEKWIDRRALSFPLEHEKKLMFTQFFRPILAGDVRALVGQLIAVDTRWRPHITPLIGALEALQGPGPDIKEQGACVAILDVRARRCGAPAGLEALMMLDPGPKALEPFVLASTVPHRAKCLSCHDAPPNALVEDLPEPARAKHLEERREAFMKEARARIEAMHETIRQLGETTPF